MVTHAHHPAARVGATGSALALLGFLGLVAAAAAVGSVATASSVNGWYLTLAKPWWTPPGALIGAVWSVLYAAMAVAAWLVWRVATPHASRRAFAFFGAQLALNAAWSLVFFGARAPAAALAEIALLWVAVAATCVAFWRVDRRAGWLLVPYWAWVSFAAVLNAAIVVMN